jgi:hypothetical protein
MTIQQVISNEKEINELVLAGKAMQAFIKYYGQYVTMIESDGTTRTGKVDCQAGEEAFFASVVDFRSSKLLSSVVLASDNPDYEFLVVATWYSDYTTTQFTFTGNQTSLAYWKDGMIQKVTFKSPAEIIV